jgi:hypothetical protein
MLLDCTTRLKMGTRRPLENNAGCRCRTETKSNSSSAAVNWSLQDTPMFGFGFGSGVWREWEGPRVARDPGHRWPVWARIRGGRAVLASLACANPHVRTFDVSLGGAQRCAIGQAGAQQAGLSDALSPPLSTAASVALNCTMLCLTAIQVGEGKITRTPVGTPRPTIAGGVKEDKSSVRERVRRRCQVPAERTSRDGTDSGPLLHTTPYCAVMS